MTNGFKIEVPITVKGGKEGEKVGKQIGTKIAEQIKQSFKSIGFGKGKAGGVSRHLGIGTGAGIGAGMAKFISKATIWLAVIGVALVGIVSILKKSSPYLKGILSIFGRAFMIFFRPFGDFLATMLRPLAVWLLKMATKWLKFTRSPLGQATGAEALVMGAGKLKEWLWGDETRKVNDWLWTKIEGIWDYDGKLGEWLWGKIEDTWDYSDSLGKWLWDNYISTWDYGESLGKWLWDNYISTWDYGKRSLGVWLWDNYLSTWDYDESLGTWLWKQLKTVWDWGTKNYSLGDWLWSKLKTIWDWGTKNYSLGDWLWDRIRSIGSKSNCEADGTCAIGSPFIPADGLYKLHRGEQVLRKSQAGGQSVIFKPTFQITSTGIQQDIDMDAIVRRAGRMTEMELKKRGIL